MGETGIAHCADVHTLVCNAKREVVSQVREDCPQPLSRWYRHISKGAWPFSSRDHGWPIADCSAEGLKAWHPHSMHTHLP